MIEIKDIEFSKNSFTDPFGKVFFYRNEIYRIINNDYKNFCLEIFDNNLINELIIKKFIPETEISHLKIRGFEDSLIIKHKKLIQSYANEWTFDMLIDTAVKVLELRAFLNKRKYDLKDGHSSNILFDGPNPLWVDIGSIIRLKNTKWESQDEFIKSFLVPIEIWKTKDFRLANSILSDKWGFFDGFYPITSKNNSFLIQNMNPKLFLKNILLRNKIFLSYKNDLINYLCYNLILKPFSNNKKIQPSIKLSLLKTDKLINKLKQYSIKDSSTWEKYHSNYNGQLSDRINIIVEKVIELNPNIILDIAGNQGLITETIRKKLGDLKTYIVLDIDHGALNICYKKSKNEDTNIHTFLSNFICSPLRDTTLTRRFNSDLVLALAITHHLILGQSINIVNIVNTFFDYTTKFLLVEFMPLGLWSAGQSKETNLPDWYNLQWFQSNIERKFKIIEIINLEENRILLICEKSL
jgi:hypothetical protein